MYAGGQAGVVVIQPTGAMTTVPHGYTAPGQQAVFIPQQVDVSLRKYHNKKELLSKLLTWEAYFNRSLFNFKLLSIILNLLLANNNIIINDDTMMLPFTAWSNAAPCILGNTVWFQPSWCSTPGKSTSGMRRNYLT